VLPSAPSPVADLAEAGVRDLGRPRVPPRAARPARAAFSLVRGELPHVTQPLPMTRGRVERVAPPSGTARGRAAASCADVTEPVLESGFPAAPLDRDAERIFQETDAFITRLSTRKTARDGT
jgi:carboxylesterase